MVRYDPLEDRQNNLNQQLFFHPDFTVGSGISPDQSQNNFGSRGLSPPVGNFTLP
jgi:hypothetical protein